uniref:Predicted protein n=1 Tax=Hordeum vulgare subsp. vulgare TaxID=112509 RepID=F2EDB3_HORVV|nr:predicted protein [Hordeum vulgare subsp. vulgare]
MIHSVLFSGAQHTRGIMMDTPAERGLRSLQPKGSMLINHYLLTQTYQGEYMVLILLHQTHLDALMMLRLLHQMHRGIHMVLKLTQPLEFQWLSG